MRFMNAMLWLNIVSISNIVVAMDDKCARHCKSHDTSQQVIRYAEVGMHGQNLSKSDYRILRSVAAYSVDKTAALQAVVQKGVARGLGAYGIVYSTFWLSGLSSLLGQGSLLSHAEGKPASVSIHSLSEHAQQIAFLTTSFEQEKQAILNARRPEIIEGAKRLLEAKRQNPKNMAHVLLGNLFVPVDQYQSVCQTVIDPEKLPFEYHLRMSKPLRDQLGLPMPFPAYQDGSLSGLLCDMVVQKSESPSFMGSILNFCKNSAQFHMLIPEKNLFDHAMIDEFMDVVRAVEAPRLI